MDHITLYRANHCWIADMSRTADAATIRELFGTDQLPTPCTEQAPADMVLRMVSANNPHATVTVR